MASNDGNDQKDTGWSHPLTVETASKRQQLAATTAGTLTLPPPPGDDSVLPFELITEILCRLPVKFLMTLICVCKSWNSLISSDRKFARKHLGMSRMNPKLISSFKTRWNSPISCVAYPVRSFFNNGNGTIIHGTHINFPFNSEDSSIYTKIEGSCDGILCLSQKKHSSEKPLMIIGNFIPVVLWNPSTRKYNLLPYLATPNLNDRYWFCERYGLLISIYGFGYDHLSDNYKVVAVFIYKSHYRDAICETQVKVHTLGTDSWRLIQDFPSLITRTTYPRSGKFVSGKINWLVHSGGDWSIVSLDLGTESYQQILPPDYGDERLDFTLGISRDCLCIVARKELQNVSDIWLMKEYGKGESWTKLVSVSYMAYSNYYPYINQPLHISEDNQVLLDYANVIKWELVVYDPINSTFKIPDIENYKNLRQSEIYIESLISPCS